MKKFYLSIITLLATTSMLAQEASYEMPAALRYLATLGDKQKPVCNLTTRNPMNNGATLWAPVGSTVTYRDNSTGAPQGWTWESEGGKIANANAQDALVTYPKTGTFNFPKLTVGFANGTQTANPDLKLKVGGVAELCLADCREWLKTYALGVNYYDNVNGAENGSLGGTNARDIIGIGNLYMTSIEDGFIDGVNVYLPSKPTKWKSGARIGIRLWMASLTENSIQLTGIPLEGGEIKFEDIKTADDGAWVPVKGGAVINFKCAEPIDLFGKPLIFIDVYGWSNDPKTEDFKMLMDVMPNKQMEPEFASNMLAHNSFVRLKGEDDYMRPVSYYGGNYGSCMICPLVRGGETPVGSISTVATDSANPFNVTVDGDNMTITGDDAAFSIFNMAGQTCLSGNISNGTAQISIAQLSKGIYVVRTSTGHAVKFIAK